MNLFIVSVGHSRYYHFRFIDRIIQTEYTDTFTNEWYGYICSYLVRLGGIRLRV